MIIASITGGFFFLLLGFFVMFLGYKKLKTTKENDCILTVIAGFLICLMGLFIINLNI